MAELGRERGQPTHHSVGDAVELGIEGLGEVTVIGGGGSSTVYSARQYALDRTVAIKVVHAAWSIETRERFEHEREVMGRLSGHAAIVPIFETGITRRGEPYLLMPYYERGSLFRLMQDRGPLPWREAGFIIEALARTVAEIHASGVVHRDLKPGNVLLTDHLQPRLVDFGITLPSGSTASGSSVAYTPSYSPPEAFTAGVIRPSIDVYSLGSTLWALLAGRAPFTDADARAKTGEHSDGGHSDGGPAMSVVIERSKHADLEPPTSTIPEPLWELITRAMAREPEQRPANGAEFVAQLRQAIRLSESSPVAAQSQTNHRPERVLSTALLCLVGVGFVLMLAGVVFVLA